MTIYLEIVASVLVCISTVLIAIPRILGLKLFAVAGGIWVVYFYLTGQYWALSANVFCLVFDLYGIWKWRNEGIR
jgi:hypothetical protein